MRRVKNISETLKTEMKSTINEIKNTLNGRINRKLEEAEE